MLRNDTGRMLTIYGVKVMPVDTHTHITRDRIGSEKQRLTFRARLFQNDAAERNAARRC